MQPVYKTVLVSAVVGLLAGGGTYWYMHAKSEQDKKALQNQVSDLTSQVSTLKATPTAASAGSTASTAQPATTTPTDTRKTYTNSTYGISFKYPKDWIVSEHTDAATGIFGVGITDKVVPNSDYPGMAYISVYPSLSVLDNTTTHTGKTSLKAYLDASSTGDAYYANVKTATVGGKSGYSGDALVFAGGTYYIVERDDHSIVQVHQIVNSSETNDLLTSLVLTK